MQAIIMSAYRDYEQLDYMLDMYSMFFDCYVHIDKKADFADDYHISKLNQKKNVTVISDYNIKWGSYYHLLALSKLLDMALKNADNIRFHLISDTDFPAKSYLEFESYFDKNEKNYIEICDITNMPVMQKRYQIFHLQHIFDRKSSNKLEVLTDKVIRNLQYALSIHRKTSYKYKGLVWGSLSREGAKICMDYLTEDRIKNLKYCENSEEFWLTNALLDSSLKDTVDANNLRYAVWANENANGPRLLKEADIDNILGADVFFARKVFVKENRLYEQLYNIFVT